MKKNIIKHIQVLKKELIKQIINILKMRADKKFECNLKINNPEDYMYAYLDLKEIFLLKINHKIILFANCEQFDDEVWLEDALIEDLILIYKDLLSKK